MLKKYFKDNNYKDQLISFIVIVIVAGIGAAFDLSIILVERIVYSLFNAETYTLLDVIALCIRLFVFASTVILLCLISAFFFF